MPPLIRVAAQTMPPRSRELWVFPHRAAAQSAGFGGPQLIHPSAPNAYAWWPTLGIDRLCGLRFHRVTVTEGYARYRYERSAKIEEADQFLDRMRGRLVEPAIWIDL